MKTEKFTAVKLQLVTEDNGGWQHRIQNSTLYLKKGNISMKLESDEIADMLKALGLGGDFLNGYNYTHV